MYKYLKFKDLLSLRVPNFELKLNSYIAIHGFVIPPRAPLYIAELRIVASFVEYGRFSAFMILTLSCYKVGFSSFKNMQFFHLAPYGDWKSCARRERKFTVDVSMSCPSLCRTRTGDRCSPPSSVSKRYSRLYQAKRFHARSSCALVEVSMAFIRSPSRPVCGAANAGFSPKPCYRRRAFSPSSNDLTCRPILRTGTTGSPNGKEPVTSHSQPSTQISHRRPVAPDSSSPLQVCEGHKGAFGAIFVTWFLYSS